MVINKKKLNKINNFFLKRKQKIIFKFFVIVIK